MLTIDQIKKSINDAENLISKLPEKIATRDGLSSKKIRHFLNNICSFPGTKYLNVGVCTGSSFWSAIYNNSLKVTGIDWWRNDTAKQDEATFLKNLSEIVAQETVTIDRHLEIINQDCFTVDLKDKYNIYFYDADHSEEGQCKALTYFNRFLEDEFILIVDDWDDKKVKAGTLKGIKEMNYDVKFVWEHKGVFGMWDAFSETWWHRFLVCLIKFQLTTFWNNLFCKIFFLPIFLSAKIFCRVSSTVSSASL